jgi:hypothetical protein
MWSLRPEGRNVNRSAHIFVMTRTPKEMRSAMSKTRKLLLGLGGAAIVAAGIAGPASAQVAAGVRACELYAREYAAVHVPQFGLVGWNLAYRHGYRACLSGGPSFIPEHPVYIDLRYGYSLRDTFAAEARSV